MIGYTTRSLIMDTPSLISQIHASPLMAVCIVTGGGTQALADLFAVPGASRTVLEAIIPYSAQSQADLLGALPAHSVSAATAAAFAQAAYQRAARLRPDEAVPIIGLACTAALVSDQPKKGAHRAHIGVCDGTQTQVHSLTLQKGVRDRQGEERLVSDLILHILADACGLDDLAGPPLLPTEQVIIQ